MHKFRYYLFPEQKQNKPLFGLKYSLHFLKCNGNPTSLTLRKRPLHITTLKRRALVG